VRACQRCRRCLMARMAVCYLCTLAADVPLDSRSGFCLIRCIRLSRGTHQYRERLIADCISLDTHAFVWSRTSVSRQSCCSCLGRPASGSPTSVPSGINAQEASAGELLANCSRPRVNATVDSFWMRPATQARKGCSRQEPLAGRLLPGYSA